jgi:predicted RNA binding protein YcfA (HicA-like mRNA interferase family)
MKTVSGKDFCKALRRAGWVLERTTKSSHFIFVHQARPGVSLSVPVHGNQNLKTGLQRDLMKAAGLTEADL